MSPLPIDTYVQLFIERIYDILWKHLDIEDVEENDFKSLLEKDIKYQLESIIKDYKEE